MYLLLTVYSMRRHTSKMHYKEDDLVGTQAHGSPAGTTCLEDLTWFVCFAGETHFIH